ncbi:hypothetical protein EKK58_01310 [Candidatus Dependentiae bacterium]|nr:MAG: hypothetical protein EKK58_01310 [Candidatus Dependentiae bacterium]
MAQSLVVDWLNENEYRSYPLRLMRGREVLITGLGRISPGEYSSAAGGYLMNGATDTTVDPPVAPAFSEQIQIGDQIQIEGVRATVINPLNAAPITEVRLYTSGTWAPPENYQYFIVKKNFSADSTNTVDHNYEGLFLDANLVYPDAVNDSSRYGQLVTVYPSGDDLIVEVYGQENFTIPDYRTQTYPYYVRNTQGSLVVIGSTAQYVRTPWLFTNWYFEYSTISRLDGAWKGVTGLSFNGAAPVDGYVEFLEGYQVGLTPNVTANSIKITASKGAGKPIGCDRIFGDDAPDDCDSLLSYINGAFARTDFGELNLVAGNHIAIYPDPDRHRIYVGLTFNQDDICTSVPARPVSQI